MKKLGYLFVILFWLLAGSLFAQPDDASWLNVTVQTDNYGGESSWEIINSDSNTVAVSPPLANNTLTNIMIFLPAGEYSFIMYDSFGDGICCSFGNGFYGITNNCGLEEFNYEFALATDTIPFTLEPCLPVLLGCMNDAADNYNPWANQDDGSCEYFIDQCYTPFEDNSNCWIDDTMCFGLDNCSCNLIGV